MSDRLPRLSASAISSVLEKLGFKLARQTGSHRILKNAEGRRVTLPFHGGKILHPKVLKNILADADIDPDKLRSLLR